MEYDEIIEKVLPIIGNVKDAMAEFLSESEDFDIKEVKNARKHIEKALEILINYSALHTPVMYGPPEILFSEKDEAEERLRAEVMVKLINKRLLATQWKEIVKEILHEVPESRATIDRLISE